MPSDRKQHVVDTWKTIVEVQMHFNDIEMKIRGTFITLVLALCAGQGFLIDKSLAMTFGNVKVLYFVFMPWFGVVGTMLFYFMDRNWYHRLLTGAVKHAIAIEQRNKKLMP
jgi:hypothetical protein